jgi:hypothetical protein
MTEKTNDWRAKLDQIISDHLKEMAEDREEHEAQKRLQTFNLAREGAKELHALGVGNTPEDIACEVRYRGAEPYAVCIVWEYVIEVDWHFDYRKFTCVRSPLDSEWGGNPVPSSRVMFDGKNQIDIAKLFIEADKAFECRTNANPLQRLESEDQWAIDHLPPMMKRPTTLEGASSYLQDIHAFIQIATQIISGDERKMCAVLVYEIDKLRKWADDLPYDKSTLDVLMVNDDFPF